MNSFQQNSKGIRLEQAFPVIEEKLRSGGEVKFAPHGVSMLPLIRQGRDSVTISAVKELPGRGDVVFYRRPDGNFVLHRIVGSDERGYILCGDNQREKEYGVENPWIIGIMTSICRDGKEISCQSRRYGFYVRVTLPLWKLWLATRLVLGKIKRRIKKIFG